MEGDGDVEALLQRRSETQRAEGGNNNSGDSEGLHLEIIGEDFSLFQRDFLSLTVLAAFLCLG